MSRAVVLVFAALAAGCGGKATAAAVPSADDGGSDEPVCAWREAPPFTTAEDIAAVGAACIVGRVSGDALFADDVPCGMIGKLGETCAVFSATETHTLWIDASGSTERLTGTVVYDPAGCTCGEP